MLDVVFNVVIIMIMPIVIAALTLFPIWATIQKHEKRAVIVGFVAISVLGGGLTFVTQRHAAQDISELKSRSSRAENAATSAEAAAKNAEATAGETGRKFNTLQNVVNLIAHNTNRPDVVKAVVAPFIKKPIQTTLNQIQLAPRLRDLTNTSLKTEVIDFAKTLKSVETAYTTDQKSRIGDLSNPGGTTHGERDSNREAIKRRLILDSMSQMDDISKLYMGQSSAYEQEIYRRLPPLEDGKYTNIATKFVIGNDFAVLGDVSTILTKLAEELPINPD